LREAARGKYYEKLSENRARITAYRKNNPTYFAAKAAERRAAIKCATPAWAEKKEMVEFYKNCPSGFEVDHIIPLQSPIVCGLHVMANLQYLPKLENKRKKNRLDA
jgi:hypothetical protein